MKPDKEIEVITQMMQRLDDRISFLQANEEKRVRLFFAVSSALVTAITLASSIGPSDKVFPAPAVVVVPIILLLYGLQTLTSVSWLKINIRENSKHFNILRHRLSDLMPIMVSYNNAIDEAEVFKKGLGLFRKHIRGSLPEVMYLSNALLVTGVVLVHCGWRIETMSLCSWISLLSVFLGAVGLQYAYSRWIRNIVPIWWVERQGEGAKDLGKDMKN